jgi:hypothetical protein
MADDDSSGDHVAKEWPLEGHFVVGGSGLHVHTDCLGRSFTTRTANYDLAIGLPQPPQPPPELPQLSPQLAQRLPHTGPPSGAGGLLTPPVWRYGPEDENERLYEHNQIMWGVAPGYGAKRCTRSPRSTPPPSTSAGSTQR